MSSAVWRPVVAIGGSGLALGLAPNGLWVVGDGSSVSRITDRLMALLPLLEQPYRKVDQTVAAQVGPDGPRPPWFELLTFALARPSEYWPGLALRWLEEGYPVDDLLPALAELKDAPGRSQPLRHRALRIWRSAQR